MPSPIVQTLRELVTPAIGGVGYELVDLEWKREQGGWVLRLFIDHLETPAASGHLNGPPSGVLGIGHEDCEKVSRELSAVLDVADVLPHAYSLEVSSPGVDRPLRTADHFRRYAGQRAKVRLVHGVDGRRNFSGRIVDVPDAGHLVIDVDGTSFTLPLDDLDRANLVYEPANKSVGESR